MAKKHDFSLAAGIDGEILGLPSSYVVAEEHKEAAIRYITRKALNEEERNMFLEMVGL